MDETIAATQLDVINQKLDIILEEIRLQRRHRQEMDDLKDDLMRVGKDLYQTAVVELEDIHDQFSTADLIHLGKKLMRNVDTISRVVGQLESLKDFLEDVSPLARQSFIDFMGTLDEVDQKGYFAFFRELGKAADNVVTSFSADDVRRLAENAVTILNTVKNLTQPEMLQGLNSAVGMYKKLDIHVEEDVTLRSLFKELNTPEARRGMAFAIRFLKSVSALIEKPVSHG